MHGRQLTLPTVIWFYSLQPHFVYRKKVLNIIKKGKEEEWKMVFTIHKAIESYEKQIFLP